MESKEVNVIESTSKVLDKRNPKEITGFIVKIKRYRIADNDITATCNCVTEREIFLKVDEYLDFINTINYYDNLIYR